MKKKRDKIYEFLKNEYLGLLFSSASYTKFYFFVNFLETSEIIRKRSTYEVNFKDMLKKFYNE